MKIVYSSSFLNPHLIELCQAFKKHPDISQFFFIQNSNMSQERKQQGFVNFSEKYDFLIDGKKDFEKARKEMLQADVVIFSSGQESVLQERMQQNKLTFRCSERFYKLGLWRRFIPASHKKKKEHFLQYKDKNFYYLCMGAYVPFDLRFCGFPVEKCFQWGYLPQIMAITPEEIQQKQHSQSKLTICWAARMVAVKHPEKAIKIALQLKQKNIPFELTMIGGGVLLEKVKKMVHRHGLQNEVKVLGNCLPEKTQEIMKQSQTFLFTSDYWEGWGAVLNESMGLGCIPVACVRAGSTTMLVNHTHNGFCFDTTNEAVAALQQLAQSQTVRDTLAQNAYQTIQNEWNAQLAAQRFVQVCKDLLSGKEPVIYAQGLMAKSVVRYPHNYIYTDF